MKRVFLLVLTLCAGPAYAGSLDGNKLFEECSATASSYGDAVKLVACNNYVVGVVDGYRLTDEGDKYLRIPDGVTGKQLQDIVLKYLMAHPEKRHWPGSALVINAVLDAFPAQTPTRK